MTGTTAELRVRPSPRRAAYDEQGYLVVPGVFTPDEIAAAEADLLLARKGLLPRDPRPRAPRLAAREIRRIRQDQRLLRLSVLAGAEP
jgi:hypothetical protein